MWCDTDTHVVFQHPPHLDPLSRRGEEIGKALDRQRLLSLWGRGQARDSVAAKPVGCDPLQLLQTLALLTLFVLSAPLVFSQQVAPKDVLPPTPQKPPVSPTLTTVAPASVSQPSVNPTTITPLVPAAPQQSKPDLPQPAAVETNKVPASLTGQPLPSGSTESSPWNQTNAAQSSVWDKTSSATKPAGKPAADLWSSPPPNAHVWDSATPVNSGTKTEWK